FPASLKDDSGFEESVNGAQEDTAKTRVLELARRLERSPALPRSRVLKGLADRSDGWRDGRDLTHHTTTMAALKAALAREEEWVREKADLLQRQNLLAQEFEHRLVNSMQLITSLLSSQSRRAKTAEAAGQLTIAANRVAALGRVHRRLHLLDHRKNVEFTHYLEYLCDDLSELLLQQTTNRAVLVTGANVRLPTTLCLPLGLIVHEHI